MKPPRALPSEVVWFRSLHYGVRHFALWWLIWPDARLEIGGELDQPRGGIRAFATAIHQRTRELRIEAVRYTAADYDTMTGRTGKHAEGETRSQTFRAHKIPLREATHDPAQGWTRIAELLERRADGRPSLTIGANCPLLIRALSNATRDPSDPELVAASAYDAPLLALRVGAMSRPAPKPYTAPPMPKNAIGHLVEDLRREARLARLY